MGLQNYIQHQHQHNVNFAYQQNIYPWIGVTSTTSSRSATKNDRGMNLILKINHRFSFIASKNKDELSSCEFLLCLLKISLKNQFNNWIIRPYFQKIYISSYS